MTPGLHDLDFDAYRAIDAINHSLLKAFSPTPAHGHYAMTHGEEQTDEMILGSAIHCAFFEPARFSEQYIVKPKFDKRRTGMKEAEAEWIAEHSGCLFCTQDDLDALHGMCDVLQDHPTVQEIMRQPGKRECSAIWRDENTNVLCKGRFDLLLKEWQGAPAIFDLKSTGFLAAPWMFAEEVNKRRYHWQGAMYVDGAWALSQLLHEYYWIVVESKPPHGVKIYHAALDMLEQGRQDYQATMAQYLHCRKTGVYPGYPPGIDEIALPRRVQRMAD